MYSARTLFAVLVLMGAGWGITQPFAKIAVSTGYLHYGLIFWQLVIGAMLMMPLCLLTGRAIPWTASAVRIYVIIALIGTILPQAASYRAIVHLPAGLMSILLSLVPIFAFPVAIALGNENFAWKRLLGLLCGFAGILLIVAPDSSLPDPAMLLFIPLALVSPLFYAFEGNFVARWGTAGLDAIQVITGASIVGAVISLPIAIFAGHWINPIVPWGAAEYALIASSVIHVCVYASYVWIVGQAGPVFAAQVSYLVTAFGVFWAMTLLGERYSIWVWAAFGILMVGLTLVQPRRKSVLAVPESPVHSAGD